MSIKEKGFDKLNEKLYTFLSQETLYLEVYQTFENPRSLSGGLVGRDIVGLWCRSNSVAFPRSFTLAQSFSASAVSRANEPFFSIFVDQACPIDDTPGRGQDTAWRSRI
jgi:hypothetical protein